MNVVRSEEIALRLWAAHITIISIRTQSGRATLWVFTTIMTAEDEAVQEQLDYSVLFSSKDHSKQICEEQKRHDLNDRSTRMHMVDQRLRLGCDFAFHSNAIKRNMPSAKYPSCPDLYAMANIKISPDPQFKRDTDDLPPHPVQAIPIEQ